MSDSVIVIYASEHEQRQVSVPFQPQSTVRHVIERSGLLKQFPEINLLKNRVGIYGKLVSLEDNVRPSDRVEIYRPLTIDPKAARRLRAEKKSRL